MRSRLNVRAIVVIFAGLSAFFTAEFLVDFLAHRARGPVDLTPTFEWAKGYAGNLSRAANVQAQLVITAIALAIPLTSTIYTPKFIDIFLRDRVNQLVLGYFLLGMGNAIFVDWITRESYIPRFGLAVLEVQFTVGAAILIPYYFYMFRALNPSSITAVLAERTEQYMLDLARRGSGTSDEKDGVRERIHHLGSIVLRSLERSDRDVALEAVHAIQRVLRRYALLKCRFPQSWRVPERRHFTGLSDAALAFMERDGTWVERTAIGQLELAYQAALSKVPDTVSEITNTVCEIAMDAARADDLKVLLLAKRFLNGFIREALKKKDLHAIYDIFEHYGRLARDLLEIRPAAVREIARHLRYYGELARATGTPFVCELVGYDLAQLVEWAYTRQADCRVDVLDTLLAIDGGDQGRASLRLAKAKVLLAAFFRDRGHDAEADRVLASIGTLAPQLVRQMERDFAEAADPEFWEVTDRQINFDHVSPERAPHVAAAIERLREAAPPAAPALDRPARAT